MGLRLLASVYVLCRKLHSYSTLVFIIILAISAPDIVGGSGHPEAFQRLIDMELRSNAKKIHPFAGGGQSPGMYGHGHELDMGLGFR